MGKFKGLFTPFIIGVILIAFAGLTLLVCVNLLSVKKPTSNKGQVRNLLVDNHPDGRIVEPDKYFECDQYACQLKPKYKQD